MIKKDVLKLCKKCERIGWITHTILLDIYEDDEDIPEDVVHLIVHEPHKYIPITILVGEKGLKQFEECIKDYIDSLNTNK